MATLSRQLADIYDVAMYRRYAIADLTSTGVVVPTIHTVFNMFTTTVSVVANLALRLYMAKKLEREHLERLASTFEKKFDELKRKLEIKENIKTGTGINIHEIEKRLAEITREINDLMHYINTRLGNKEREVIARIIRNKMLDIAKVEMEVRGRLFKKRIVKIDLTPFFETISRVREMSMMSMRRIAHAVGMRVAG